MSHIKISVYYDATGCSTSRYPYITMQQNVPHQDIRTFRCNRMSHIKISAHYDATECPTSRYPHISVQQDVPHHDDYFPFLQRPLDQLNGGTPDSRRCKPLTPPTLSFASPSLPTVCSVLLLLCRLDQYCLHHDTFSCSACPTAGCWYLPTVQLLQPLQVNALCTTQLLAAVGW